MTRSTLPNARYNWGPQTRYALAIAFYSLALLIRVLILPVDAGWGYLTFYPMMVVCFYICGVGPGLLMAGLSAVTGYYAFLPPYFSFLKPLPGGIVLITFLIAAGMITWVVRGLQSALQLAADRESALRASEASLRQTEDLYKTVLQDQTELISRYDTERRLTYVNDAFCRFFGKTRENLIGQVWTPLPHPEEMSRINEALSKISKEQPIVEIENRVISGDGNVRWCRFINRGLYDDAGALVGLQSVGHDITDRKALEDKINQLAFNDPLTHLPNRRLLADRLLVAMAANQRNARFGALMLADLDNFKPLNDSHGHEAGDLLLIEVAHRLVGCVRSMDTVARLGGDEFVVMVSDLDADQNRSKEQAIAVAEKIRLALAAPYEISVRASAGEARSVSHRCYASIGLTLFPEDDLSVEDLLHRADLAMYQAKAQGRNRVIFYAPDSADPGIEAPKSSS